LSRARGTIHPASPSCFLRHASENVPRLQFQADCIPIQICIALFSTRSITRESDTKHFFRDARPACGSVPFSDHFPISHCLLLSLPCSLIVFIERCFMSRALVGEDRTSLRLIHRCRSQCFLIEHSARYLSFRLLLDSKRWKRWTTRHSNAISPSLFRESIIRSN